MQCAMQNHDCLLSVLGACMVAAAKTIFFFEGDTPLSHRNLYLQLIAITLQAGGVTYDVRSQRVVPPTDAWYFPKYPGDTVIVPQTEALRALARFCYQHEAKLREAECFLGLWQNPETGEIYIDITTCLADYTEAIVAARMASEAGGRQIVAICNPYTGKTAQLS